jgi:hypothetical protein
MGHYMDFLTNVKEMKCDSFSKDNKRFSIILIIFGFAMSQHLVLWGRLHTPVNFDIRKKELNS